VKNKTDLEEMWTIAEYLTYLENPCRDRLLYAKDLSTPQAWRDDVFHRMLKKHPRLEYFGKHDLLRMLSI
jgi:hypothetical protein